MKQTRLLLLTGIIFIFACNQTIDVGNDEEKIDFPKLSGNYLGQNPPDTIAEIFAPGIISTGMYIRDIAMMPDGKEIYFCITALGYNLIFYTKEIDGIWTKPALPSFVKKYKYMYYEPCISADGKKLFFLSNMPKDSTAQGNEDIWVTDRVGDTWSEPYNLGEPICTESAEFFPSVTNNGTLYFTRQIKGSRENVIYRSKLIDGKYQEPEKLPEQVNCGTNRFNAYISRDESFMIIPAVGLETTFGDADYYISFRNEDDTWQEPINMGAQINSKNSQEWSTYISPDNKYLFFMSARTNLKEKELTPSYQMLLDAYSKPGNGNSDIYWISTKVIDNLRLKK